MRRLKNILLEIERGEKIFDAVCTGEMIVNGEKEYDNVYWSGDVGFEFGTTHKLAIDKPTVTLIIPCESVLSDEALFPASQILRWFLSEKERAANEKRSFDLVRLYHILKKPTEDNNLYAPKKRVIPNEPNIEPWNEYDNQFYLDGKMYEIEMSGKLEKDKPAVTCHIPIDELGFERCSAAAADLCLREFIPYLDELNGEIVRRGRPAEDTGKYIIPEPGGEVLVRNSAYFALCPQKDYENIGGISVRPYDDGVPRPPKICLCLKMQVQLPRSNPKKARNMLCVDLPSAVKRYIDNFDFRLAERAIALSQKQAAIREWLKQSDCCAFIANGSVLPRSKGTNLPMEGAVPFLSTPGDEIEVCGIRGMGIKRGVTVITGGGYSGKSTILDALAAGVYDHVEGDGRELCITDESAVTVSAEDGRSVKQVNVSPFIRWLPGGDAARFSTDRASGSTSQAANIMEAVDAGSRLLLIDEDRSATNFMIRDSVMKRLIESEPIIPFTDRVNELYREKGVSTILVLGGSGEYLSVADRIYMMREYRIEDATERAKELCGERTAKDDVPCADWSQDRVLGSNGFSSYPDGSGSEKLAALDMGLIIAGDERIDLRGIHDIVEPRQIYALAFMLRWLEVSNRSETVDLSARVDELYRKIADEGLDCVFSSCFTDCERFLDLPRREELLAVINRMRLVNFS